MRSRGECSIRMLLGDWHMDQPVLILCVCVWINYNVKAETAAAVGYR